MTQADRRSGRAGSLGFPGAEDRAAALGELHARPYPLITTPRVIIHLAFLTDGAAGADHAVLSELSRARGVAPPEAQARHHTLGWGHGTLRWERHTEFSTYSWEGPVPGRFGGEVSGHPFGGAFSCPGSLISGVRLEIRRQAPDTEAAVAEFDPQSLCYSEVEDGRASALTDFRQDREGLTRILVIDRDLSPARAGALAQRLIEIETYRTLALLGLPLAHALSPQMRRAEEGLSLLTQRMRDRTGEPSRALLDEITGLAAGLEASGAAGLYRFGASRAYDEIVEERLASLHERAVAGYHTWTGFLQRRLAPAMRTCRSIEERQANLSRKLARATALLRSWIDVDLEQQNSALLKSMDRRARLQLRLQQTVEGLSVAAISYYVIGLLGYAAEGLEAAGLPVAAPELTGLAVPVVVLLVWLLVRAIRRHHDEADGT